MRVLPALAEADGLALVELDAAIALRAEHYVRRILLIEGFFEPAELPEIAARRLAVVVHNEDQVRMLEHAKLERPLEVFVKINSGMNRLGVPPAGVAGIVERLNRCESVAVLRLMTHLARADEEDGIADALATFDAACRGMPIRDRSPTRRGRAPRGGRRRDRAPGIMLYGATPFPRETAASIGVEPVMTLRSEIIAIQSLRPNESVGYGGAYTATRRNASASSPAATPTAIRAARRTARRSSCAARKRGWRAACRWISSPST
jgi:alanine racemase